MPPEEILDESVIAWYSLSGRNRWISLRKYPEKRIYSRIIFMPILKRLMLLRESSRHSHTA
jgi:hypothetical protein